MSDASFLLAAAPADGWIGRWSPGIGDPTALGWLATLGYAAAARWCWVAMQTLRRDASPSAPQQRESGAWLALTLLLAALGVNKQLDLQGALTELGRMVAFSGGWYEQRRTVQLAFVICVALAGAGAAATALWASRRASPPLRVAIAGAVALLGFVVVRAASFEHFALTEREIAGIPVESFAELAGIATTLAAALWHERLRGG